jgi:hypothetical protein
MMAQEDAGGSMLQSAVALSDARKKSDDLTTATVPAGTTLRRLDFSGRAFVIFSRHRWRVGHLISLFRLFFFGRIVARKHEYEPILLDWSHCDDHGLSPRRHCPPSYRP